MRPCDPLFPVPIPSAVASSVPGATGADMISGRDAGCSIRARRHRLAMSGAIPRGGTPGARRLSTHASTMRFSGDRGGMSIPIRAPGLCMLFLLVPPVSGGLPAPSVSNAADSVWYAARPAMGTTAEVWISAASATEAEVLIETAFAAIEQVEATLSTYRSSSEASRFNARAADEAVVTDPETFAFLRQARQLADRTDGAFDVTVGALVEAWGFFRGTGRYPAPDELARAKRRTGWRHVSLDESARTVRFLEPGLAFDFGGIGKGRALDRAARALRRAGAEDALLGMGQSSWYAMGSPPDADGWTIVVPDPQRPDRVLSTVYLRDRALSTSGSGERHFDLAGKRYSHIIDPRTGHPAMGMAQATVIAKTAAESDALSTAMFVLEPERSRTLAAEIGVAALLVTSQDAGHEVFRIAWPGDISR